MRQSLFSLLVLLVLALGAGTAQAQCEMNDANDHTCGGGAQPAQPASPVTPAGTAIQTTPAVQPVGRADVIDYSVMTPEIQQYVAPNLTQESDAIEPGECVERTLAPGSTTSIPFTYNGTNTSMNVAQGSQTRTYVSNLPGYDPQGTLSPGAQNDFYAPCYSQANLPPICGESTCEPDPNNENSINLMNSDQVVADPYANRTQCPVVAGERYYLNLQNEGSAPICVSVGNGTNCPPCYTDPGYSGGY